MTTKQKIHKVWKLQTEDLPNFDYYFIVKNDLLVGICMEYKPTLCQIVKLRNFWSYIGGAKILSVIGDEVTTYSDQNGKLFIKPKITTI